MKKIVALLSSLACASLLFAQTYPEPEFSNEVYYLKKDNPYTLTRLEKASAKQVNKANMIKGAEFSYLIEGKSAPVRLSSGSNLSFVMSSGKSSGSSESKGDSALRANGLDPASFSGFTDPSNSITLYKVNVDGGDRKIYMQKTGGALPFSSHKNQSSEKYTFSLKKIREGYWEFVVDKPLPKGEYAFYTMGMGMQAMGGSSVVFAFGID